VQGEFRENVPRMGKDKKGRDKTFKMGL